MPQVFIPSLMRDLTEGQDRVTVSGSTVRQVIDSLEESYPGMKERLVEKNKIRGNISVAVDGEVTPLGMLEKVTDESEVYFLPPSAAANPSSL